jgi:hypothetical protein
MPRLKPIICNTPEELAVAMGLPPAEAKEWQVQHERLKGIVRQVIEYAEVARRVGNSRTRANRDS